MRLLICEFITGGGMLNEPLPPTLAREGELMLQSLVNDLAACDRVTHIDVLRDARLELISGDKVTSLPVALDFLQSLKRSCDSVDVVLPVAPESSGILQRMTELITGKSVQLLASDTAAVELASGKRRTLATLAGQGIAVVPVVDPADAHSRPAQDWVIKPDDGVGGEGCRRLPVPPDNLGGADLLQPFIAGCPASLSLLCTGGRARLLAVNEQYVDLDQEHCQLRGVNVNGLLPDLTRQQLDALQALADAIAAAIPGLWGWVGVDGIFTDGAFTVLEINPRLTTAYCGLHQSLQHNPAEWLLDLAVDGQLPAFSLAQARPVEVWL
ncbi:putative ATP-grasp superfamily ATP-dependent carboligase [Methylohalomonas lacus]|uniref:ATP-grasp superfamily ATP-dependent carboligase n=1 Tax=Methylohalomonas lacus TaxID=398773 RepID=A0AAE3HNC8_9GAMM|nr:ATP-grasp domain-containing protein [Methylohalomonas lacus]MCS3904471.1 putative ATP-grasp superfamily ATP-dependent carboligase [Methylohalomonas lacus]